MTSSVAYEYNAYYAHDDGVQNNDDDDNDDDKDYDDDVDALLASAHGAKYHTPAIHAALHRQRMISAYVLVCFYLDVCVLFVCFSSYIPRECNKTETTTYAG